MRASLVLALALGVGMCSLAFGSEDAAAAVEDVAVPAPAEEEDVDEGDDGDDDAHPGEVEFTDAEAERMTTVTRAFITRFEAEFQRTPTIGVGIGFVHFDSPAAELLDSKLIGEAEPAAQCAAGTAVTLQAVIEGDGPDAEPFFLDVVTSGTEELRVFRDPTQYDAFVALENIYFEALGGAEDPSVAKGGPWAEAVLVDSAPREETDGPVFDCHLSFLLVSAPQGIYGDEGAEGGAELSDEELREMGLFGDDADTGPEEAFEEGGEEGEEYYDEGGDGEEFYEEGEGDDYAPDDL